MSREVDVFVSSKMEELKLERQLLNDLVPTFLTGLVTLRPRLYETAAPASNSPTRELYLDILKKSAVYIGVFWNQYGEWTIDEFNRATEWGIHRLIFVKDVDRNSRDERLVEFLNRNSNVISSPAQKWFKSTDDFRSSVEHALEEWLIDRLTRDADRQKRLYHLESFNEPIYRHLREYEAYLTDYPTSATKDEKRHRKIVADAIITCRAIGDRLDADGKACLSVEAEQQGYLGCSTRYKNNLTYIAMKRLTPNCVVGIEGPRENAEVQRWQWYGSRNRDALYDAVSRLQELIEALER